MPLAAARRFVLSLLLLTSAALAQTAPGTEIVIGDAKSQPESLTLGPGNVLFTGSASSPFLYKVRPGATTAEKFFDATAEGPGTFFLGMLADAGTNTLWTCQLTPIPNTTPARRRSVVRSFDIATGTPKLRWTLPGETSVCNDLALGPDKALYFTDTPNSKIYRLAPGAATPELYLEDRTLNGVDGITFLDGVLYVTNVVFNKLYRIPVDAAGKPGRPVDIWMDQPVKGPDGMRAANGKLFLAENASGRITVLTVTGEKASVTLLRDGLKTPTAVEPAGDLLWIAERSTGKAISIPMPR